MVFSSMVFLWVFLPTVFVVHRILGLVEGAVPLFRSRRDDDAAGRAGAPVTLQNVWLLVASLVFYAWGEPKFVFVMIASIGVNYASGLLLGAVRGGCAKKAVLAASVLLNLGVLGYFKYFSTTILLVSKFTGVDVGSALNILLPVGISFYTFQALSYVVDVYRGVNPPQRDLLLLALYITLFPQLVAGPIVKYKEVADQLKSRVVSSGKTIEGIERFIWGLGKKVLVANQLAVVVDQIYALPPSELSTSLAWAGALLYALQIYFDFSGYSDMAIGLGMMFGFRFPENFNLPYLSRSIREFWRRWHISLSTWFKEYLYIPLGGNRRGRVRTYVNLLIVFFATGVWHGAGLSFIVWGLYHGFFMVVERLGFGRVLDSPKAGWASRAYCLLVVVVGWVFFRADSLSAAVAYLRAMFVPMASASYSFFEIVSVKTLAVFAAGLLLCGPLQAIWARLRGRETTDFLVKGDRAAEDAREPKGLRGGGRRQRPSLLRPDRRLRAMLRQPHGRLVQSVHLLQVLGGFREIPSAHRSRSVRGHAHRSLCALVRCCG